MGGCSSMSDMTVAQSSHLHSHSSNHTSIGRINVRLLMNVVDTSDNRKSHQRSQRSFHLGKASTLTLEQACKRLQIKELSNCVLKAKNYSRNPRKGLKQDEQAAINLYTQQNHFYAQLNNALRQNDEHSLIPWREYLKLFLTALYKLPPYRGTVWRGIKKDLSAQYRKNDEHVWWAFSSCTSSVDILESPNFLGGAGARTLFSIEVCNGRLISEFSEFVDEDEILLLPGTRLCVVSVLKQPTGLHIIHLKQIEPSYTLFEPLPSSDEIIHSTSYYQPEPQYQPVDMISEKEYEPVEEYYEPQSMSSTDALSAFNTQIQLANSISSDSEKARVLVHVLSNKHLTDQMIAGVAECAKTFYDSSEMADVLKLIAKRSTLSDQQFRVSMTAVNEICDDEDKADTLKEFLVHEQFTVQHLDVVLSATETIYSGSEKASVFLQLIRNRYLTVKHFPSVLNGIETIDSDDDKSEVLCKLAPRLPKNDGNVRRAYLTAASSIYECEEKAAAAIAFM